MPVSCTLSPALGPAQQGQAGSCLEKFTTIRAAPNSCLPPSNLFSPRSPRSQHPWPHAPSEWQSFPATGTPGLVLSAINRGPGTRTAAHESHLFRQSF